MNFSQTAVLDTMTATAAELPLPCTLYVEVEILPMNPAVTRHL